MMMGAAQVPVLSDLEAEIERRGLRDQYGAALINSVDTVEPFWFNSNMIRVAPFESIADPVIALTRLTETQKVQAALKVLEVK